MPSFQPLRRGWKGLVARSEVPANSKLLGQHEQVQAIPTLKCSLTECTCLPSSSVILNLNRLQCVSRFNSHLPGNYTATNSNCKQTLNPTWLNASGSLLRTWAKPACLALHPSAGCYPWLATTLLPDVSQIASSPAVKSPLNFMQSKCNNLDRGPLKWLAWWCSYPCGSTAKLLQICKLKLVSDILSVDFTCSKYIYPQHHCNKAKLTSVFPLLWQDLLVSSSEPHAVAWKTKVHKSHKNAVNHHVWRLPKQKQASPANLHGPI